MRAMLICLSMGAVMNSFAQQVGKLRLLVDPGNSFQFVLDHQYRMQQREVELAVGDHHFTFWAPERRMLDTTLTVTQGAMRDVVIRLELSNEYRAYLAEYRTFRNKRQMQRIVPALVTAGAGVWTILNWSAVGKAQDRLDDDAASYDRLVVPAEIQELKNETIPAHNDDLRSAKTNTVVSAAIFGACLLGTAWIWHKTGKRPAPAFNDHEKVRFDGLVFAPGAAPGDWNFGLGLTLR